MIPQRYPIYIDISAKIEAWDKDSIIAISNGRSYALRIASKVKIGAAALLDGRQPVQFRLMAIFTYIAIRPHLASINRIVLDMDYSGEVAKRSIVRSLIELVRRDYPGFKASHIRLENIADHKADTLAREVYIGVQSANGVITLGDIEAVLRQ